MRDAVNFRTEVRADTGSEPYIIPFGGTTPLSTTGQVNAGLEFAGQVFSGAALAPDVVYVPLGSMGTAAGIALGLALGGLTPLVMAVQIVPDSIAAAGRLEALISETAALLETADATFPRGLPQVTDIRVLGGYLGEGYAQFTSAGMEAVRVAANEGLRLEGTYTGKTMAALLAAARSGEFSGANVLYWDTYNSHDLSRLVGPVDYLELPEACNMFFETDVQPLDRAEA
jgi:D-cysteine desulfhydrase